jgi:hypothetical protein
LVCDGTLIVECLAVYIYANLLGGKLQVQKIVETIVPLFWSKDRTGDAAKRDLPSHRSNPVNDGKLPEN